MRILIGADCVPTPTNEQFFIDGNVEAIVGKELKEIIDKADLRIFNLECALTDSGAPIKKAGPNICAPTATINGYKALKADVLGIANNHVFDFGREGFISTIETLDEAGIKHVGGGMTKEQAKKPVIIEKEGKKIGIYACCEHEFSWIEDYGIGTNGFDALDTLDEITELKSKVDYCIVLYHGGKEHYVYPTPYLYKVCRKIVDKGADIVLCQHTHCVGTEQDYKGSKIVFGQGNFVFAKKYANNLTWGDGLLVSIDITEEGVKYDYIPYNLTDTGINIAKDDKLVKELKARSEEIKQEGFIEKSFETLASETVLGRYAHAILGFKPDEEYVRERALYLFHFSECEVHRESIITGLRKLLKLGKYGEFDK